MDSKELGKTLARLVKEHVASEIAALEERLAERETKTLADSFKGPWMPGHYERGALVQRDGLWIALESTDTKPGEGQGWRLLVKSR